jgi:hypothetical protein
MKRSTTTVLAGVAIATLAAAGAAAVVNYRRGHYPDPEQRAQLDELDARLRVAEAPGSGASPSRTGRVLDSLRRNHGIPVSRLRSWITGVTQGTLSPEQSTVAESDFDTLERQADQSGA